MENSKCACGTVKALFNCEIYVRPDQQPYNDESYEDLNTEMPEEEKYIYGYIVMYCEKCKKFDQIEKSDF